MSYGRERVYRNGTATLVGALIFIVAGLSAHVIIVSKVVNGEPLMISARRSGGVGRPATPAETVFLTTVFPTMFWGLGFGALLFWKNYRIVTTDDHIRVDNWLGRTVLDSRWDQIVTARYRGLRERRYVLDTGQRKVVVYLGIPNWQELDRQIQEKIGHRLIGANRPARWS